MSAAHRFRLRSEQKNRHSLLLTIHINVISFTFMRYENRNTRKVKEFIYFKVIEERIFELG